ncbi:MAG: hypothetical protein GX072_08055 [Lysinibacillus sp.]|nr:hypothetical protein [Lysinibacillus sp.]
MKKVYLLFTDTGTLFTKMIKLYTKKAYNHASIAFDNQLQEVYSFGRKNPRNPFIGGFVKEDIRNAFFMNSRCAMYSFWATEEQIQNMKKIIYEIEKEQQRYKYNLTGLITYTFNKPSQRKNAYFCSQFVAHVLKEGAGISFNKPVSLISPYELQCIENLNLEYEGPLYYLIYRQLNKTKAYTYKVV